MEAAKSILEMVARLRAAAPPPSGEAQQREVAAEPAEGGPEEAKGCGKAACACKGGAN